MQGSRCALRYSAAHRSTGGPVMSYVWMALVGFVVGLIARAILPGSQSLGIVLTTVLGIAGSFAAGFVGQALGWYQAGQGAGFIGSVLGAIVLLFVVSKLKGPGASTGS
jgi:uncharacterized membrane protein YeaQ/YmgE (transglycosylase-associated protein family)